MRPLVVLVGPPGAGKTEVGRLVAERLGVAFHDTDADVEALAGASVGDIFVDQGEEYFRELEREAVRAAFAEHDGVLALGGGAVLDDGTQELLRDQHVVYLEVGFAEGMKRVGLARDRPVFAGNPRAQFRTLLEARRATYERVAKAVVATDEHGPAEVAERVLLTLKDGP